MNRSMPVWAGWLMLAIIVVISLVTGLYDRSRRVATGMPVRPMRLLWARVGAWVVGGGLVVLDTEHAALVRRGAQRQALLSVTWISHDALTLRNSKLLLAIHRTRSLQ